MSRVFLTALAILVGSASAAPAQQPPPPAAKADKTETPRTIPSTPSSTTATYGDWVLRCFRIEDATAGRLCEVVQVLRSQGQSGAVAQIAFGRVPKGRGLRMTVVLPHDVSFPSVVRVIVGDGEASLFDLAWRHCLPSGCLADAEVPAASLERLRTAGVAAGLVVTTAAGKAVRLPVSLSGLSQALDAAGKE